MAIAPNLTTMVGELVGARLIAHAGSLLNLAKHPSSTVQILGAEKALCRERWVGVCLFVCDYVSCAACICRCGTSNPDTKWGRRSVLTAIHTRVVHAFGVGKVSCFDHARPLIPVVYFC